MRIFITGIQGFLGSTMAREFRRRGWAVAGSARAPRDDAIVRLALGDTPKAGVFAGFDVVVHGAYDAHGGLKRNRDGTRKIYEAAKRDGAGRQILLSSYSARPEAPSTYGRMKFALEQLFQAGGQTIVRPGMVTGGGMFGRLMRAVLRWPLVPLIDGGRDLTPLLDVDDFARVMARIVEQCGEGPFNLFAPRLLSSRRVVELICEAGGHRALLLPVPGAIAIAAGELAFRLRLVKVDAAAGARMARINRVAAYESNLMELIGQAVEPEEAIRRAVSGYRDRCAVGR